MEVEDMFKEKLRNEQKVDGADNTKHNSSKDGNCGRKNRNIRKLCEEKRWIILNGNIEEGDKREFTYIEAKKESVIDYVIVDDDVLEEVESFKIEEEEESD
ncbi:hypothetical protein FQR65_LT01376 [Abscondita terminalis]|nr:hypothetical protein FQR65_LT01376 [Abscondita terminalis]